MDTQEAVLASQQSDHSEDASGNAKSTGLRLGLFEERDVEGVSRTVRRHHAATVFRNQVFLRTWLQSITSCGQRGAKKCERLLGEPRDW